MSAAVNVKDAQDLRKLIPLNILSATRFEELCAATDIQETAKGSALFTQGDNKNEFVYVLTGTVSLQAGGMEMETISGGTESARFALAHQIPRKVSAIAKDRVRFIRVDASFVNQPSESTSIGVATYEVSDMPEDSTGDWITTLLKSPIFQRLPPSNLQSLLGALEEMQVKAGQKIIRQDEPGDYYYIIKKGRCALTRKPTRLSKEIKLAELKTCDTFGEDSLISDEPRNVSVTMLTDGALLRLNKPNFLKLVKEPAIAYTNMEAAQALVAQGAVWLDVRAVDAFDQGHLPGAINIPFFKLRTALGGLERKQKYILVCEAGRVSEAAAFLLIRYAFQAYVLTGGISGVFKDQLVYGPAEQSAYFDNEPTDDLPRFSSDVMDRNIEESLPLAAGPDASVIEFKPYLTRRTEGESNEVNERSVQYQELEDTLAELRDLATRSNSEANALAGRTHTLEEQISSRFGEVSRLKDELLRIQALATSNSAHGVQQLAGDEDLRSRIKELESSKALAEDNNLMASTHIRQLETQVDELSALVQEFVERQADGAENNQDELQSLRAELEMVRIQASEDVIAMQSRLRSADEDNARLKVEMERIQQSSLITEAKLSASSVPEHVRTQSTGLTRLLFALLGSVLGVMLLTGLAIGTEVGRTWMQHLISK